MHNCAFFFYIKLQPLVHHLARTMESVCRITHANVQKNGAENNVNSMLMCAHQRKLILTVRTVVPAIMMHFVASYHARKVLHFLVRLPLNMSVNMKRDTSCHQTFHDAITVSVFLSSDFLSSSQNSIDYILKEKGFLRGKLNSFIIFSLAFENI